VVGLVVATFGDGLIVITTFIGIPGQALAEGVTIYVTVPAVVPGLVSVWEIEEPLDALAPVIPPVIVPIVQLKVVPDTLLFNTIFVVSPLHMVVGPVVVTFGAGLTVTNMFFGMPGQPFAEGVTIYITVPAVVPGFVSVCIIVEPLDAIAPLIPPVIGPTVQL